MTKNIHAVELGRLGGLKGGKARFDKLSPERLKEIAKMGAAARWGKSPEPVLPVPPKSPKPKRRPPVQIFEPIDFQRLSEAYAAEHWRWSTNGGGRWGEVPSAQRIEDHFTRVKNSIGDSVYSSSGGITAERKDGNLIWFIHPKLADHYQPTTPDQA